MLGYVAFLLLLFLPGLLAGTVTGILVRKRILEKLAVGFGLSLVLSPVCLLIAYALVHVISDLVVYTIVGISGLLCVLLLVMRGFAFEKPILNRIEAIVAALVPIQGLLLWLQFVKYPIFPSTISSDFRFHLQVALQLTSGQFSIPNTSYPPAIHTLIAALLSTEQSIPLATMQVGMAIMATIAPILVFVVASKVLGDQRLGLVASVIYVISGVVWYSAMLTTGLYANLLADFVTLTTVYLIATGIDSLSVRNGILILVGSVALYLSHYTVVIFIVAMWISIPFFWLKAKERFRNYLKICGLVALPGVVIVLARPDLIGGVLGLATVSGEGAGVIGSAPDALASFLSPISPFLSYLYQELGIGLFALAGVSIALGLYFSIKRASVWISFFLVWFLLTWAIAPYSTIAWRFSKVAVLPLLFLMPAMLLFILQPAQAVSLDGRSQVRRRKVRDRSETTVRWLVLILVIALVLFGSPTGLLLQDVTNNPTATSQNQAQVYDAMNWLASHDTPGARILGLEDWRFSFMTPIWGNPVSLYANTNAASAVSLANQTESSYIIVSKYLIPGPTSENLGTNLNFEGFQKDSQLVLIYSNPSVDVFSLKS